MNTNLIVSEIATNYAEQHSSFMQNSLLNQVYQHTVQTHPKQHMQSSKLQAGFLQFLIAVSGAKKVLELGTFTGFSALSMAEALPLDGELHTIECREQDAVTAQSYFNQSARKNQIHLHTGEALHIIPQLNYKWDMVFIDADKINYINYYNLLIHQLNDNGFMVVDNVLFHGQVFEQPLKGKNAIAIDAFNKHVAAHAACNQLILTVRDGLMLIKKNN